MLFKCRFVAWRGGLPRKFAVCAYVIINKRSFESFMCLDLLPYTYITYYVAILYVVERQISMLFTGNKDFVFCI